MPQNNSPEAKLLASLRDSVSRADVLHCDPRALKAVAMMLKTHDVRLEYGRKYQKYGDFVNQVGQSHRFRRPNLVFIGDKILGNNGEIIDLREDSQTARSIVRTCIEANISTERIAPFNLVYSPRLPNTWSLIPILGSRWENVGVVVRDWDYIFGTP